MEPFVIYPKSIYLVKESRVQDGTVATLAALKTDQSVYAVPRKGEEGVMLNYTEEGLTIRERSSSGVMLDVKNFRTSFGLTITINLGRWDFNIEALLRGDHPENVETDHTASIAGANDSTAVTGIAFVQSILKDEFTMLCEMNEDPASGETLYFYVPKATRNFGDREMSMNVNQVSSPLSFRALALDEDVSPSQVVAHQAIYNNVTADELGFFFKGKPDTP